MLNSQHTIPSKLPDLSSEQQVIKAQVYLLFKTARRGIIGNALAAIFLSYMQAHTIPLVTNIVWTLSIISVLILRSYCYFTFHKKPPQDDDILIWKKRMILHVTLTGALWGLAAFFMFPANDFQFQAVTMIILAGMAAGSVTTLSPLRETVWAFLSLALIPLIIRLYLEDTAVTTSFSFLAIVYLLFLYSSSAIIYRTIRENVIFRITSLAQQGVLKASKVSLQKTSDILEMIAKGLPAKSVYHAIILYYESLHTGLRCSILELDGSTLKHGAAPNLPEAYCNAVDGLTIGPKVGSCGASTYTGERVIVEDIETDPKWKDFKTLALSHNLHCCWSEPIKDARGHVLGSFAMYYDHPALPTKAESDDLTAASRLVGIVMEREHRKHLLKKMHCSFEYAEEAIAISSLEAQIEYVNPAFEALTGYSSEELIGKYSRILRSPIHPDSFYIDMMNTLKQGKIWHGEVSIKRKNGTLVDVERSISPILDENNTPLFHVVMQRDISQQKEMEANFHQAQKMEAIGTLVGGIAHDFNNILAGITGNVYLAKKTIQDNPKALDKITRIDQLTDHASGLIKQLLTFSRKDTVHMQVVCLPELIKEIFSLLRTSIPENIEVHYDITNEGMQVLGDKTQIHQILLNLINNARDAVAQHASPTITLQLHLFDARSLNTKNHAYFKPQTYAHLSVHDNGTGIPQETIKFLFEPFYTTKEVGKGTGLGLAMVFGAVKRHDGFIDVTSVEGEGSSFHVYFPLISDDSQPSHSPALNTSVLSGNQEVILLIDDNKDVLEMSAELLEDLKYKVLQATNGLDAVKVFKDNQHNISLVITDIVMPKMGGAEAVAEMRKTNPNIQAIFTTGYDQDTARTKSLIHGDDTVLSKPYDIEELSQVIQQKLNDTAS